MKTCSDDLVSSTSNTGTKFSVGDLLYNDTDQEVTDRVMQTQRTSLLALLPEQGWQVARTEENLDWWADEMWFLESTWSPVGSRAYITFLVDPQFEGNRRKGEAVWAVMASLFKPTSYFQGEHEFIVSLGQGWKDHLPALFAFIGCLRGANPGE